MVKILIPSGFSLFFVRTGEFQISVPTTKSWFLVPIHDFWISIPSIENENFVFIPYAFSNVAVLNPILVLFVSLPLSTIDSNPLEAIVFWNH
jgi:hypothetical protein